MKKNILIIAFLINSIALISQENYFPPKGTWEVREPSVFGINNQKIQNAIKELTKNKTTIVIAHRLSTILNANKIYIIESGKVLEEGTHESLIEKSATYKNFYNKQLKKD